MICHPGKIFTFIINRKGQVGLKRKIDPMIDYLNKSVVKKRISKPTARNIKSAITKVFNEPHPKNFELLEHYLTFVSQHVKKGDPFNRRQDCLSNLSPILFENMMNNIRLKQGNQNRQLKYKLIFLNSATKKLRPHRCQPSI